MPRVYTEEQRQRQKEWRLKNKEKQNIYFKEYYQKNKEKKKIYQVEHRLTEQGIKCERITTWKKRGVVSTDYNLLYDNYLASTNCEECGIEYGKRGDGTGLFKCLDHCHETGLFRNYLCNNCNIRRR